MAALLALDAIDGDAAVEALATGLSDEAIANRRQVIESLWNRGTETTYLLGQVVFGDPDPRLRLRAIELLAEDGSNAARSLVRAAVEDGDLQVSETARALLDVWDPEHGEGANAPAAPVADESSQEEGAFALLLKSADPMDRILAVRASYATHGEAAIGMLGRLLVSDPDVEVRLEAVTALGGIDGSEAVAAVAAGLGDGDVAVRRRVLDELWQRGSGSIHLLGQVLFGDSDPTVRIRAVELLAADGTQAALALLQSAALDADGRVSDVARQKLGLEY